MKECDYYFILYVVSCKNANKPLDHPLRNSYLDHKDMGNGIHCLCKLHQTDIRCQRCNLVEVRLARQVDIGHFHWVPSSQGRCTLMSVQAWS